MNTIEEIKKKIQELEILVDQLPQKPTPECCEARANDGDSLCIESCGHLMGRFLKIDIVLEAKEVLGI